MKKELNPYVLTHYLKKLGIIVPYDAFMQVLSNYSQKSFFLALSTTLDFFEIENYVVKISFSELQENQLPVITCIRDKNNDEQIVFIEKIHSDSVILKDSSGISKTIPTKDFTDIWQGIAIYALPIEKKQNSFAKYFMRIQQSRLFLILLVIGYSLMSLKLAFSTVEASSLLIYILGFLFCILLKKDELGYANGVTRSLCQIKVADCKKVAESKASSIFGFKLSDIGIIYFSVKLILLTIGTYLDNQLLVDSLLQTALLSTPFILFSLIFQLFYLKKICPLCIGVVISLIAEILLYLKFTETIYVSLNYTPLMIILLLLTSTIYFLLMAFIEPHAKYKESNLLLLSIKSNKKIFQAFIQSQPKVSNESIEGEIVLGDVKSKVSITVLLSLNCKHCLSFFNDLVKTIDRLNGNIAITLKFTSIPNEKTSSFLEVFRKYNYKDQSKFINALTQEFRDGFKEETGAETQITDKEKNYLKANQKWTESNKIEHVPAIIAKQRIIPSFYSINDIYSLLRFN
jgi:uncharacterized membrane protein